LGPASPTRYWPWKPDDLAAVGGIAERNLNTSVFAAEVVLTIAIPLAGVVAIWYPRHSSRVEFPTRASFH
jgi:hypothetical protein